MHPLHSQIILKFGERESIKHEVDLLQTLDWAIPSLVSMNSFHIDDVEPAAGFIVMDDRGKQLGELYKVMHSGLWGNITERGISPDLANSFLDGAQQILQALCCMHADNVAHQDITLENIVVERAGGNWVFTLLDLSSSKRLNKANGYGLRMDFTRCTMADYVVNPFMARKVPLFHAVYAD
ncbi:unnamed protein product, partial [Discosporangium mesarthrocarpum]